MNLQKMMQQAQKVQQKINEMQANLEQQETEGASGGGLVKIVISGKSELRRVKIDDSLMKPDEKEVLEDLLVAAFNDAKAKVDETASSEMAKIAGGLGLPPGFKLPM